MFQRRFDLPFGSDLWLSILVGAMMYVASVAFLAGMFLDHWANRIDVSVHHHATVLIPHIPSESESKQIFEKINHVLKQHTYVVSTEIVDPEKIKSVLGSPIVTLPTMIDITIDTHVDDHQSIEKLEKELQSHMPGIRVQRPLSPDDGHVQFIHNLQTFLFMMVVGMMAITFVILIISIHAEVSTHQKIIQMMSLIGAPHSFIARRFRSYVVNFMVKGFVINILGGIVSFAASYWIWKNHTMSSAILAAWQQVIIVFALIPMGMLVLSFVFVPMAVKRMMIRYSFA